MNIVRRIYCIVLTLILLLGGVPQNTLAEGQTLQIDPSSLSFSLHTSSSDKKAVVFTNPTEYPIQYALLKEANPNASINEANIIKTSTISEEVGSPWRTPQYDYSRTGYNSIESTLMPFEQKWRFQGYKSMLTPVLSGSFLYIPSEDGRIYVVNSKTGVKENTFSIGEAIYSVHLYQRYLIVCTNIAVILFDRISEKIIWKQPFKVKNIYGVAAWEGLLFIGTDSKLMCLDLITGKNYWFVPNSCSMISSWDGYVGAVLNQSEIAIFDARDGKELHRRSLNGILSGPAVLTDEQIFYCVTNPDKNTSILYCSSKNGKLYWQYPVEETVNTSIALDEKNVYLTTANGNIIALDRFRGVIRWQKQMNATVLIPPVIASTYIFIGDNEGTVKVFMRNDGSEVWANKLSFPLNSPLVVAQGFLYLTDNAGSLYSFCRTGENVIPPYAPARLTGYPGDQSFTLTWDIEQPSPDLAGYHIYRQKNMELDFTFYDSVGVVSYYQDSNLENGLTYKYIVRAYDTYGNESVSSRMVSGIPSVSIEPLWLDYSPTAGSIAPGESKIITIEVDGTVVPPGHFEGSLMVIESSVNRKNNRQYIHVTLNNKSSTEDTLQPPVLSGINQSDSRVKLTWEKYPGIWNIEVYRSTVSKDEMRLITTLNGSKTEYTDDQVSNGTRYFYSLKAVTKEGKKSTFSNELSTVPLPVELQINTKPNVTTKKPVFIVSGRADPKAILTVNNHTISLDFTGVFQIQVGVPVGLSTLRFNAKATDGSMQEVNISVNCLLSTMQIRLQVDNSKVHVNGDAWPWDLESPPLLKDQRTFIPLRFVSEIVGGEVKWDSKEKRIDVLYKQNEVILWIGKNEILVNGEKEEIDTAPFIFHGRTMIPLRFVTEPLGASIDWDSNTQTILLTFTFS